MDSARSNAR